MTKRRTTPSWTQQDGAQTQRERRRSNERARRLRSELTPTEERFWKALRLLNREGARFRRQIALDDWVFDFGDLSARLLIELDGGIHERIPEVAERDARKSLWTTANRFGLLRFKNDAVWGNLDDVMASIRTSISDPHPQPPPRKGEGEEVDESPLC